MHLSVSGKNLDVGASLREHVEKRLQDGVNKYLDRVTDATVVVSKEAHLYRVDINIHTGTHSKIVIKSAGEAADVYASFNAAADKVEKQLRRYKRKLKNHHNPKVTDPEEVIRTIQAKKFVLAPDHDEEISDEKDAPIIIAEKETDIQSLTVGEAVMKMDLEDLPALMFVNKAHGGLNVVYRRTDGNISWVDPRLKS